MVNKLIDDFNTNIKRYWNGVSYIEQHPDTFEKYIDELDKIQCRIDKLINCIEYLRGKKLTKEELLYGIKK